MIATPQTRTSSFDQLSVRDLYALLRLRSEVFVLEQKCVYQDLDGLDQESFHCLLEHSDVLLAGTRLLPPGLAYGTAAGIGRVVSSPAHRGMGYGRRVMLDSLAECASRWPRTDIVIHAQSYLLGFYGSFGFEPEGEGYLEDGIPHFTMRLAAI